MGIVCDAVELGRTVCCHITQCCCGVFVNYRQEGNDIPSPRGEAVPCAPCQNTKSLLSFVGSLT